MNKDCIFGIIGGDMRQAKLANMLAADGFCVYICGFENCEEQFSDLVICSDMEAAARSCDCVVLGLPYSHDGEMICAPYSDKLLFLGELYPCLRSGQLLTGGRLDKEVFRTAQRLGFRAADYFEREELAVENAVITAEGAIQIIMEELPVTVAGSNCLITGYGRIGRCLGQRLRLLGSRVMVCARSCAARAWARSDGLESAVMPTGILLRQSGFDAIVNTIPSLVFDEKLLRAVGSDTLLIDLASKPGGIDFPYAAQQNLKAIWALSLPGKVAPVSSGRIIERAIFNIIEEAGE